MRSSKWLCLFSMLCLIPAGAFAATVGEVRRTTTTPTAALRDAAHSDQLRITIWYPATGSARERPLDIGPPGAPLFVSGSAAPDAAFAPGRHPAILLSHGFGGSARVMGWFGTELARDGYVVVAVDHPGNNGADPITSPGAVLWWERAEDLKAAWAAVRADATIAAHIDPARLGVAGFSAGGFTALLAGGARVDVDHFVRFCTANPKEGTCRPQEEAHELTSRSFDQVLNDPDLKAQFPNAPRDHSVPGVKAIFAMSPGPVQGIAPDSFARIRVPTRIVVGLADGVAEPASNADIAAKAIPGARITHIPAVGHYDFLGDCTAAGRVRVPQCASAHAQEVAHRTALSEAKGLFDAALK